MLALPFTVLSHNPSAYGSLSGIDRGLMWNGEDSFDFSPYSN